MEKPRAPEMWDARGPHMLVWPSWAKVMSGLDAMWQIDREVQVALRNAKEGDMARVVETCVLCGVELVGPRGWGPSVCDRCAGTQPSPTGSSAPAEPLMGATEAMIRGRSLPDTGWYCPRCGTVYAPGVMKCECSKITPDKDGNYYPGKVVFLPVGDNNAEPR